MMPVLPLFWSAIALAGPTALERVQAVRADASFALPTIDENAALSELCADIMRLAPQGQAPPDLEARAAAAGYTATLGDGRVWLTDGKSRGGGVLGVRLGPLDHEVLLQAPHPFFDQKTGAIVSDMFDEQPIRAVLFASAQRYVAPEADAAHVPMHAFNAATDGLVRGSPQLLVVQIHGFAARSDRTANIYVSGGRSWWTPTQFATMQQALQDALPGRNIQEGGAENGLAGVTNTQARLLAGRTHVLLLEFDPNERRTLAESADNRAALWRALATTATDLHGSRQPMPQWGLPTPLPALQDADGFLVVPAGRALRFKVLQDGVIPRIVDEQGILIDAFGLEESWVLPAASAQRRIRFEGIDAADVWIWRQVARKQDAAWDQWERTALAAIRKQTPPPTAIAGAEAIRREMVARQEAGMKPQVQALGLLHDLALHRPVTPAAFAPVIEVPPDPTQPTTWNVEGPARVRIRVDWTTEARAHQGTLTWNLDGATQRTVPLRTTSGAARGHIVFVPPGSHVLRSTFAGSPATLTIEQRHMRPSTAWPSFRSQARGTLDAAEWAYLTGQWTAAEAGFRRLADQEGPVGTLARARLLTLGADLASVDLRLPHDAANGTTALLAHSLLERGAELSNAQAIEARQHGTALEPAQLALWLDAKSSERPIGAAVWNQQLPFAPPSPVEGREYTAHLRQATSIRSIDPEGPTVDTWRANPPGIPRAKVAPGEAYTLTVPEGPLGRPTVLRLRCTDDCSFSLQDTEGKRTPFQGPAGRYDVAVRAGTATVSVETGTLLLLDPELVNGPTLVFESTGGTLPAQWKLPGAGVPVDLRPDVQEGGTLTRAIFDDGTIRDVVPGGLVAPAEATSVWFQGSGVASLAMRISRTDILDPHPRPVECTDASLARLEAFSQKVHAGDVAARWERARVLGCLGLPGMARTELDALRMLDSVAPVEVQRLERWLIESLPDAPTPGPIGRLATTAALGAAPGATAAELQELAATKYPNNTALWREVALAWEEAATTSDGSGAERDHARYLALAAAQRAGLDGELTRARLLAQLDWDDVCFAEESAGIDQAILTPPLDHGTTLAAQARRALWAWPWPADDALRLRGNAAASIQLPTHEDAALDLACRDDASIERPCTFRLTIDGQESELMVPVGAPLRYPLARETAALDIKGPGEQHTASIRLMVDGNTVTPTTERQVLRASAQQPIVFVVAAPAALRFQSLDNEPLVVHATPLDPTFAPLGPVTLPPNTRVLAGAPPDLLLPENQGPTRIEIAGSGRVWVRTAVWKRQDDNASEDELLDDAVYHARVDKLLLSTAQELGAHTRMPEDWGHLPGSGGTWELAANAGRDQVWSPTEPWPVAALSFDWHKRQDRWWQQAGAWVHGPNEAGGFVLEMGRKGETGWTGGRWTGRMGRDIANQNVRSTGLVWFGVMDRTWNAESTIRLDARVDALLQSAPPIVVADPAVWTEYRDSHPLYSEAGLTWMYTPARESRIDAGFRIRSNTGPSIDRLTSQLGFDRWFGTATQLSAQAALDLRLADEDRAETNLNPRLNLRLQQVLHSTPDAHLRAWTEADWQPRMGGYEAWIGLRYLRSDGRGLRDLAPYRELFRTEMEGA